LDLTGFCSFYGKLMFASISGVVFWPYCAGIVVLVIGIFTVGKEVRRATGIDKGLALGALFFAIPMAEFGAQHFTEARPVSTIVPSWIPGALFWTYLVGTALEAAALSIATKKQARWAALSLAAMLVLFILLMHIPKIVAEPKNVLAWGVTFRDLGFSGGALALACNQTESWSRGGAKHLVSVARVFVSATCIFFGVEHFLHPGLMPAVDLDRSLPAWIRGGAYWNYFAGAAFLIAGICLMANWKPRWAATLLSASIFILVLFIYLPITIAAPADIDGGLNYMVSTLAFCGVALLIAKVMPRATRSHQSEETGEVEEAGAMRGASIR
jgi:uncharacterized membrane protein